MRPDLTVIIVNWNGGELLRTCLERLAASPPSIAWDLIVVDNASTDGSAAWLRSGALSALLPAVAVRVVENTANAGFSRANNQAFAMSEAPLLLLLNADTEVCSRAIDTLITTLRSGTRIGACGPRLLNPDGSLQPSVWPNPPTPWTILAADLGLWRLMPRRPRGEWLLGRHWDHARRRRVPMLSGAALLIRRESIVEAGGLDERFHMYGEDHEWCLRAVRAGWILVFEPAATVVHHGGHGARQRWERPQKLRVQLEAFLEFQRLALPRRARIANLTAECLVMILQRAWRWLRRAPTDDVSVALATYWTGLKRAVRDDR